jgi:cold shock CspA family protein
MEGFICSLKRDRGFGFVRVVSGPDYFFHATDLADGLEFDEQLQERRVLFDIEQTPKGWRAVDVRPAD